MLGLTTATVVAVALSFLLGAGVALLFLTRRQPDRWPLVPCDSSGKTAMDYLFEILAESQSASPDERERIRMLVQACMRHVADRYDPPEAYPQDSHCECLHKALSGAECANWRLVIEEMSHDG